VACLVCLPVFAQSKSHQYLKPKSVSVQKLESPIARGTDAILQPSTDRYDISLKVGDTAYACRYKVLAEQDLSWLSDKEEEVRIEGKVIYLQRANGSQAQASIVRTIETKTS
jgi:hypothetical protein